MDDPVENNFKQNKSGPILFDYFTVELDPQYNVFALLASFFYSILIYHHVIAHSRIVIYVLSTKKLL